MLVTQRTTVKFPGTAADLGGPFPWSNPNNALTDNGSDAFWGAFGGGQQSNLLKVSNFGFNIPSNAVIEGVLVTIGDKFTFSQYTGDATLVTNAGAGQNKGGFIAVQDTYGGPTDLWGLALTPADVNHANFGFQISAGDISGGDAQVSFDYITITVYWSFSMDVAPADVPQRYDYKIFNPAGKYLGNLPNVIKPFSTQHSMNSAGSQLQIEVAGTPDGDRPLIGLGRLNRWFNPAWQYRQRITIAKEAITEDLTDFPIYVDLSHLGSQFWAGVDATGKDIRITDQYGQQELPFEIVSIDTSTKTGELWFKAGFVDALYDTEFYIYYGNAAAALYAATDPYGRNAVWSAYKAVYHLNENANTTAGGYKNAVGSNDATGTSMSNAAVTGKVGKQAADFDGVDDVISTATNFGLTNVSAAIAVWAYIGNLSQNGAFVKVGGANGNGWGIGMGSTTFENDGNQLIFIFEGVRWITTAHFIPTTGWHRYWMVMQASGVPALYADGVLIGTYSGTNATTGGASTTIGGAQANRFYNDPLDEVHIRAFVPTAGWVAADYANQNSPSTFYKVGYREAAATMDDESILLRDGNVVNVWETSYYYPNGKLKFQGQINRIEASFAPEVDGTINVICHGDGRDMDQLVARGAPFSYTNDQTQFTGDSSFLVDGFFPGFNRCGQLWTANATNLGRIQLALGGNATVTIGIYTDATQATFLGSVTKAVNVPYATVVDFEVGDFIDTVVGQDYFVGISVLSGQSIQVYYKNSSNPYANGSMYSASYAGGSGGGSYAPVTNADLWFGTASGTPTTAATYTSQDPTSQMLVKVMDDYNNRGGLIKYKAADIEATGLSLTASFNTNTVFEACNKILDMSPTGFYYYVDLGTNLLKFKRTNLTADYRLVKGRHIEQLDLVFSIENVVNEVLFSGGETAGVNLYSQYLGAASRGFYGPRLNRKSDNRVKVQATADSIGKSTLRELQDEQYFTTVVVMATTMNITDIKPGQTVAFRGYGSFIDNMLLQITKVDYRPERAILQLGTLPPRFDSAFESVIRGLVAEQTVSNPSTPS